MDDPLLKSLSKENLAQLMAAKLKGDAEIAYIKLFDVWHPVPFIRNGHVFESQGPLVVTAPTDCYLDRYAELRLPDYYEAPILALDLGGTREVKAGETITLEFSDGLAVNQSA